MGKKNKVATRYEYQCGHQRTEGCGTWTIVVTSVDMHSSNPMGIECPACNRKLAVLVSKRAPQ